MANKNIYDIKELPREEPQTENYDSDSMGKSLRKDSEEEQDLIEEHMVEYQDEPQIEVQDIELEEGMKQETTNKSLRKHT
ncbi:hypothetical protein O181_069395 [Austropuccinia psidii MF-1]|uniref:Uncharacterized protein n=1 Tax=Austropuccinia psidii MF-1 TaxID=1389203 RepID=A0A9Q3EUE6_9BASI|nr:hypothetical protein [Austropuccinia psidii MF-1]